MRSLRSLENYLVVDGVEFATLTCSHCQVQVVLNPLRTRERNHCRKCHAYVCDSPACNSDCNGGFNNMLDDLASQVTRRA